MAEYRKTVAGHGISEEKLEEIVRKLGPENLDRVLNSYHYMVDTTLKTKEDRIKGLCCAIPNGFDFPAELYVAQLLQGPRIPISRNEKNLPNKVAERFESSYPTLVQKICTQIRSHKHCPEKYKTDRMLFICYMQLFIDGAQCNIFLETDESLAQKLEQWYVKQEQFFHGYAPKKPPITKRKKPKRR